MPAPHLDFAYPSELAAEILARWPKETQAPAPMDATLLEAYLGIHYHASFLTEERRPVICRTLLAPPEELPESITPPEGLHILKFENPRPFNSNEIRRLAIPVNYYRSLLGIRMTSDGEFVIWGLIQTGTRWVSKTDGGRFDGSKVPPVLIMQIQGPGRIGVYLGNTRLAELSNGRVDAESVDPFSCGWLPIRFAQVREWVRSKHEELREGGPVVESGFVAQLSQNVIRRTISVVRNRLHGGTLIFLPEDLASPQHGLFSFKYRFGAGQKSGYRSVMSAVMTRLSKLGAEAGRESVGWLDYQQADDQIISDLNEGIFELGDLFADLMGVDGALVLSDMFDMVGFGAEIHASHISVDVVYRACDLEGEFLEPEKIDGGGTRHRSVYRLIALHPECLAFVISQDGGVRFVTGREGKVVYWNYAP